jgi:phosphotransferase system IIA component
MKHQSMKKMKLNNFKFSQQYRSSKEVKKTEELNQKSLSVLNDKGFDLIK